MENFLLDLGAPQAISGLTEGIIGAKVGEDLDVSVQFPEASPAKHLAGKNANFKVKVLSIKEKKMPVIDDEFAKDLGVESLDQLKTKLQENLKSLLEKQIIIKEDNAYRLYDVFLEHYLKYVI